MLSFLTNSAKLVQNHTSLLMMMKFCMKVQLPPMCWVVCRCSVDFRFVFFTITDHDMNVDIASGRFLIDLVTTCVCTANVSSFTAITLFAFVP